MASTGTAMRVGRREAGGYRMLIVGVDVPRGLIVLDTETLESVHGCGWCGITSSAKAVCACVAVLVLRQQEIRAFHALIKKDQRKRPLTMCGI